MKRNSLKGKKFGILKIIRTKGTAPNGSAALFCICDCGKITSTNYKALKSGIKISCGCVPKDKSLYKQDIINIMLGYVWNQYKKVSLTKNLELSLTPQEFKKLILGNCFYCGIEPNNLYKRSSNGVVVQTEKQFCKYNGIDKVDPKKGYTKRNCVSCCYACNWSKSNKSQKDFFSWIARVYNHSCTK